MSHKANTLQQTYAAQIDACRALFGKDPNELLLPMHSAMEALSWLEALLKTIEHELERERPGAAHSLAGQLLQMGHYVAADIGNYVGCECEALESLLASKRVSV